MSNTIQSPGIEQIVTKARGYVCGLRRDAKTNTLGPNSGTFAPRFQDHPWVRQALLEGWDPQLRGALVRAVTLRMIGQAPYSDINDLMPSKNLVEYWRTNAARYADAKAWRERIAAEHGSVDSYLLKNKPRNDGPAQGAPIGKRVADVVSGLTPRSRAMTGEAGEQG